MIKKILNKKNLFRFIFILMACSAIYVTVKIILAPTSASPEEVGVRVKSDYTLMLLQCFAGTIALMLPNFVIKKFKIFIPFDMIIVYAVFLFCSVYLGEFQSFYYQVPHWDTILHTFSGVMLGALGFALISLFNKTDKIPFSLSPLFIAMFSFCFAVALGMIWEIYEFTIDCVFKTNMQKFALEDGTNLIGQKALLDTMKDLIVDCIGALLFSIYVFFSFKANKNWSQGMIIKKAEKTENTQNS